jgi:integrase/recombinase XerD
MTTRTDRFLEAKHAEGVSPRSIEVYRWALAYLPADSGEPLPETVSAIYAGARGKLAPQSLVILDRVFRTFFTWKAKVYGAPNPMTVVARPRKSRRFPRAFTDDELVAICRRGCESARDRAMVGLLLGTGMRLGELADLRQDDLQPGQVLIRAGKGDKSRVVYLDELTPLPFSPPATLPAVLAAATPRARDESFWGTLTYRGVESRLRAIVARAGVNGARHGAHTFRHTYATLYLRAGGSTWALQRQLGHAAIQTTMQYAQMVGNDVKADVQRVKVMSAIRGAA